MKKHRGIAALLSVACICLSMAGCGGGSGELTDADIENGIARLDGMSDEEFERSLEEAFGAGDSDSVSEEDPEAAAVAESLAESIFISSLRYFTLMEVAGKQIPADLNPIKSDMLGIDSGTIEAEIDGKTKKIKWKLEDADVRCGFDKNGSPRYITVTYDGVSRTHPKGADKIETVDAFENLSVTFSGTAPDSRITISGGDSRCNYTADITEGMFNGDTVTVTAEFRRSEDAELLETEREYTVEGLSEYAAELADIPEETLEKCRSQAEDIIASYVCAGNMTKKEIKEIDDYSFERESCDFVGYYFLSGKAADKRPYNKLYCVYKIKYLITAYEHDAAREGARRNIEEHITGEQEFYTTCEIKDIILLPDGVCSLDLSSMKLTSFKTELDGRFVNSYGYQLNHYGYGWYGYPDLDTMFNKCVTEQVAEYTYESTVA